MLNDLRCSKSPVAAEGPTGARGCNAADDNGRMSLSDTEAEPDRRHTVNSNTLTQVCRTSLRRQKGEHEAAVRTEGNVTKRVDPPRLVTVQVRTNLVHGHGSLRATAHSAIEQPICSRNHHAEEHESRPLQRWECAVQCRIVQHEPRYRNEATCGVNLPHE